MKEHPSQGEVLADLDAFIARLGNAEQRAQHMDELVEAMRPRLSKKARTELEQTAEAEENAGSTTFADAIRFLLEQEDRRAAILAKIKGGAK